ncbi:P-loop containing nucleoside triphosphate hydrolase protein [Colletotrichum caudatum]|nr:P-loop containing nucleoside triphosphate hydrolase protein [Colletotrichum caudatum]
MADITETPTVTSMEDKIAALEKRLIELELRNKATPLTEAALALNEVAEKKKTDEATGDDLKEGKKDEQEPISRVKVVIIRRDPDTGEPIEEEKKVKKSKDEEFDREKFAFILRKNIYENKFSPYQTPNGSEIDIVSANLWNLLKKYLGHFPYHIFREDPVTLSSPYDHIVYQYDDLLAEAEKAEEDEENMQARKDLKLLLDTIRTSSGDEKLDKYFKMRPNYKKQTPNTIQFEDMWTVFPPGMLVYGKPFQGEDQVFVVKDNQMFWPWRDPSMREPLPWKLDAWSYDWKDGSFSRTLFTLEFEQFDGHLPLTSLPFYPFDLCKEKEKVREKLIERGQKFRNICNARNDSRLFNYQGLSILETKGFSGMKQDQEMDDFDLRSASSFHMADMARMYGFPQRQPNESASTAAKSVNIQSRVMVDYDAFSQYGGADGRNGGLKPSLGGTGCGCSDCQENDGLVKRYRTRFDDRKFVKPDSTWDDEQYLMCPPRVLGYILQQKQWAQLQVTQLQFLKAENQGTAWESRLKLADDIDNTKIKRGKKEENTTKALLLDLVRSHASTTARKNNVEEEDDKLEVNDIISGKGKGLIILLYGPPGVGKTSTAETIAIATRKPLFSISVADVGTKAKHVEANLQRVFDLATKWQAILLIDEADVFLESRGRGNVIRSTDKNALVSVFLRVLEYYQGIMFLTTNQIAEFDVAIPSRIHIAIRYETLKEKQMEAIFTGFLDELDEKGLIDKYEDIKEWLEEVVYKEGFDGRQIRNIVTTALGLARAESDRGQSNKLKKAHIKRAFANVSTFKRDFNTQMQRYIDSQEKMIK